MRDFVKEVSSFFDDPAGAESLLLPHVWKVPARNDRPAFDVVRRKDGTMIRLARFALRHRNAFRRREAAGTPHSLSILELDLEGGRTRCYAVRSVLPNLDQLESRRTEPAWVYSHRRKTR